GPKQRMYFVYTSEGVHRWPHWAPPLLARINEHEYRLCIRKHVFSCCVSGVCMNAQVARMERTSSCSRRRPGEESVQSVTDAGRPPLHRVPTLGCDGAETRRAAV